MGTVNVCRYSLPACPVGRSIWIKTTQHTHFGSPHAGWKTATGTGLCCSPRRGRLESHQPLELSSPSAARGPRCNHMPGPKHQWCVTLTQAVPQECCYGAEQRNPQASTCPMASSNSRRSSRALPHICLVQSPHLSLPCVGFWPAYPEPQVMPSPTCHPSSAVMPALGGLCPCHCAQLWLPWGALTGWEGERPCPPEAPNVHTRRHKNTPPSSTFRRR